MTDVVPAADIEGIVGAPRHPTEHIARADTATETVHILHSQACLDSRVDLRGCAYSIALDQGIDDGEWIGAFDVPHIVATCAGRLVPWARAATPFAAALAEAVVASPANYDLLTWRDAEGRRCRRFVHKADIAAVIAAQAHRLDNPSQDDIAKVHEAIDGVHDGWYSVARAAWDTVAKIVAP